ncbi:glycosyltransferase [Solitalea koreensis]|uniref:Glycosyltransferase involved in cell wall bisynthesis n=1 Tax=Solitalea koreensis TaxID=543615 RepID=A0A521CMG6_9SPHI|nr:glycosyltransferase [Solitalea koreensis]SMO60637.1 Glycosyltransferase involved in cell wall bisynthesis [Solitalea koreensis]
MKIVLINTAEQTGGAAIACKRLMQALRKSGVHATMIVRDKSTVDENIVSVNRSTFISKLNFFKFAWERLTIFLNNSLSKKHLFAVSIANIGIDLSKTKAVNEADVIHLHWVNQGFLSLKNIQQLINTGKPIVWTMHDMWPLTGICHHSLGCLHFQESCGNCHFLQHPTHNDLSHRIWLKKNTLLKRNNIHPVAVSSWLAQQVRHSSLWREKAVKTIPNVINIDAFQPLPKIETRQQLGLPAGKKIILFSAAKINDPIKGFQYLKEALSMLTKDATVKNQLFLMIVGEIKNDPDFLNEIPCDYKYFGRINDQQLMPLFYAASNAVVSTSLYETFGQTLIEAMSCGSIPIAFNNSGPVDIIDHKTNGYLANYLNSEDIAKGIHWALFESDTVQVGNTMREKVANAYSESVVAHKYIEIYESILTSSIQEQEAF